MDKEKIKSLEWPKNLLWKLYYDENVISTPWYIAEYKASLCYALYSISSVSRDIFILMYKQGMSKKQIMKELDLTKYRYDWYWDNGLRMLRTPYMKNVLTYGVKGMVNVYGNQIRTYYTSEFADKDEKVFDYDKLSGWLISCLNILGIYTVNDIDRYPDEEFLETKGFGKKCAKELDDILEEYGKERRFYKHFKY